MSVEGTIRIVKFLGNCVFLRFLLMSTFLVLQLLFLVLQLFTSKQTCFEVISTMIYSKYIQNKIHRHNR